MVKREEEKGHVYEICVEGQLDSAHWAAWFEGLEVSLQGDKQTLIRGPVVDQASLYGLLARVRDLGLNLISVQRES
jgi:hypothetical protein